MFTTPHGHRYFERIVFLLVGYDSSVFSFLSSNMHVSLIAADVFTIYLDLLTSYSIAVSIPSSFLSIYISPDILYIS